MHRIINYYLKLIFTFHPDGDVCPAVVAAGALGGQEVAGGALEPVPGLRQLRVTHRGSRAHAQVVVETTLRLARDNLVVALVTRIIGRNKPEIGKYF